MSTNIHGTIVNYTFTHYSKVDTIYNGVNVKYAIEYNDKGLRTKITTIITGSAVANRVDTYTYDSNDNLIKIESTRPNRENLVYNIEYNSAIELPILDRSLIFGPGTTTYEKFSGVNTYNDIMIPMGKYAISNITGSTQLSYSYEVTSSGIVRTDSKGVKTVFNIVAE